MPIRTPEYEGTNSDRDWSRPTFAEYIDGYFDNTDAERPDEGIESVGDAPQEMLQWAASLTFAGDAEGETFDEVVILPAVFPGSLELSEAGVRAVLSRAPQTDAISGDDAEEVQSRARTLLEEEFDMDEETEEESSAPFAYVPKEVDMEPSPGYTTKATGSVKQVDTSTRTVEGYYASFGNVDSDREEFAPGAFERTIQRRGPQGSGRIKHLWQHDIGTPIGVPETLREDENGLYFETRIVDTQAGTDALKLYEEGVITEHSVGFDRVDQEPRDDGTTLITEVKLWEGSSVTWGANPQTPVTGMKGQHDSQEDLHEELARKAARLRKALSRNLSEQIAAQVEIGLKQIESSLRSLDQEKDTSAETITIGSTTTTSSETITIFG